MITRRFLIEPIPMPSPVAEGLWITAAGALHTSTTAPGYAVVERSDDPPGFCTGVLPGYDGEVQLKVNGTPGTINAGTYLKLAANGTVNADTGTGARVVVAQALESAVANQLVRARLLSTPDIFAS